AWDARILEARPAALLGKRIAVADATSLDLYTHRSGSGLRDFALNDLERAFRVRDLCDTHLRHPSVSPFHSGACRQRWQMKDRFTWLGKTLEVACEGSLL